MAKDHTFSSWQQEHAGREDTHKSCMFWGTTPVPCPLDRKLAAQGGQGHGWWRSQLGQNSWSQTSACSSCRSGPRSTSSPGSLMSTAALLILHPLTQNSSERCSTTKPCNAHLFTRATWYFNSSFPNGPCPVAHMKPKLRLINAELLLTTTLLGKQTKQHDVLQFTPQCSVVMWVLEAIELQHRGTPSNLTNSH